MRENFYRTKYSLLLQFHGPYHMLAIVEAHSLIFDKGIVAATANTRDISSRNFKLSVKIQKERFFSFSIFDVCFYKYTTV